MHPTLGEGRQIKVDVYFRFASYVQYCPPLWTYWIWVSLVKEDTAKTGRALFLPRAHRTGRSPMKQSWSKWMLNRVYPVPAHLKRFHWTQVLSVRQLKWKDVKLRSTLANQPREIRCLHKWNCGYHYINWTSSATESTFSLKRKLQVCI